MTGYWHSVSAVQFNDCVLTINVKKYTDSQQVNTQTKQITSDVVILLFTSFYISDAVEIIVHIYKL